MKDQARIQFRTRRVAKIGCPETEKSIKDLKEVDAPVAAFKPYESIKPQKPQVKTERRSTRIASKELKQTTLLFKKDDKKEQTEESQVKRKPSTASLKEINKKQKTNHDEETSVAKSSAVDCSELKETSIKNAEEETSATENVNTTDTQSKVSEETIETEKITVNDQQEEEEVEQSVIVKENSVEEEVKVAENVDIKAPIVEETIATTTEKSSAAIVECHDTPSPPSSNYPEPLTPPTHAVSSHTEAPYKTYLTEADKQRIEYEKTTLERLRKALDIVITDRLARNRPSLYHQIESALRNSTRRNISLSHICQLMYITPTLYTLEPTEIRNFGGKAMEAYILGIGKDWEIPFTGKDLEKRANTLLTAIDKYFADHPEFDATIPQIPLPRLKSVVDKNEWIQDAKLPPGVRALLQAHENNKKAEEEKEKPKPKPTGSVKDRMAALRARLAEKKKS